MNINLRTKLILGFAIIVILMVLMAIITLHNLNKINQANKNAEKQSLIAQYSSQIEIAILECRRAEKNYWLRKKNIYITEVKAQLDKIAHNIELIKSKSPNKKLLNQINKIALLSDEYYKDYIKSVRSFRAGKRMGDILNENNHFIIVSRKLQKLAPLLAEESRKKMQTEIQRTERIKIRAVRIIFSWIISSIIIGFLIVLYITQHFIKSTSTLMNTMKKIEAGNYQARLNIKSKDEFGVLGGYFNEMLNKIEEGRNKRKVLQQQIANAEKLASLGRLAAGIAHEINNPLTGVLTYSHLLLKKAQEGDPQKNKLRIIVKETTRCREIVKTLLNFARQTKPDINPANINEIIERSLSLVKNQASFQNIKIIKELNQSLPLIAVDPNQIQQVFINILLNAQEAMPDGGKLAISSNLHNKFVETKFTDTGCGIPKEEINKIFDPFYTTKQESQGTGLGLAVSYGIIEQHHGDIEIKSKVNKGTTVIIKLPI